MATIITEECINCGACEPECPNTAIYEGGASWELDGATHRPSRTTSITSFPISAVNVSAFSTRSQCKAVCPVDCCIPDPNKPGDRRGADRAGEENAPRREFAAEFPSRFRK